MAHPVDYPDRIKLYTRTKSKTTLGFTETWSSYVSLWASVLELDTRMTDAAGVVFTDQNQTTMKLIKVTLRGRRTLSVADSRITWRGGIFKPLESPRYPGRSNNQYTVVFCHQVDGM